MSVRDTRKKAATPELTSYRVQDLTKDLKGDLQGLKTGYAKLDEMIRIPRGAITVIGGRPGHGKTSFQLNLLANFLRDRDNEGQEFYFFSYEEAKKHIATKLIMILAGKTLRPDYNHRAYLEYLKYRSKKRHRKDPDIEKALEEYDKLSSANRLFICDEHFNGTQLASLLRNLRGKNNVGAVFIDYLQKVPTGQINPGWQRYQEIKLILENFLEILKDTDFPIIMGAQFKRSTSVQRNSLNNLRLDYLRESGDIEQDANLVLGILNPTADNEIERGEQTRGSKKIHVFVLKNRSGLSGGRVSLKFDGPTLRISDKRTF